MRISVFACTVALATGSCPSDHYHVESAEGKTADVIVIDLAEPTPQFSHCSFSWPNEEPHLSLIPAPPGCLLFNSEGGEGTHLPMHMPDGSLLHWIPENEVVSKIDTYPVSCARVISKTTTGDRTIVIGEDCLVSGAKSCPPPQILTATSTCTAEEESVHFLQETGWHRTLTASLHMDTPGVGFQWFPRQFLSEPDELARRAKAKSVTQGINIEHPSLLSPPQIVRVDEYPIPAHARVNPPNRDQSHFTVWIPNTVWMVNEKIEDCAVEDLRLDQVVKLPQSMTFAFAKGMHLVRTKSLNGDKYTTTAIPNGNPDDLLVAVVATATTAIAGALSIIFASLRK